VFRRARKCTALRPTPDPNHRDCQPGSCKSCYQACKNVLADDEVEVCSECISAYVNHPSSSVRLSFLRNGLDEGWIATDTVATMANDPDSAVALTARSALAEYVPGQISRQLRA
jgi:hypothetical protein